METLSNQPARDLGRTLLEAGVLVESAECSSSKRDYHPSRFNANDVFKRIAGPADDF